MELQSTQIDVTEKDMASTITTELSQIQSVKSARVTVEENCHAQDLDIHVLVLEANAENNMQLPLTEITNETVQSLFAPKPKLGCSWMPDSSITKDTTTAFLCVSPKDVMPLPKVSAGKRVARKRRTTAILTVSVRRVAGNY
ncbi:hypothetical protein ILUMI_02729 [Ignelater luminosus]|uniref:Uncharacterized protein n=1 Tax=Ignelater luminosus TaxID=2038154 RepID=A0A8K0DHT5_IGNLU|nr:hypothetical protein ILUMI_02729 [Ignelater luminosus]